MKRILIICLCGFILLLGTTGCNNKSTNDSKDNEIKEEKLTILEQNLLDSIIEASTESAKNPESIRIIGAGGADWDGYFKRYNTFYVKLTGVNSMGGNSNTCYELYYSGYIIEATLSSSCNTNDKYEYCNDDFDETTYFTCNIAKDNIKNVNNALKEYWEDLGL